MYPHSDVDPDRQPQLKVRLERSGDDELELELLTKVSPHDQNEELQALSRRLEEAYTEAQRQHMRHIAAGVIATLILIGIWFSPLIDMWRPWSSLLVLLVGVTVFNACLRATVASELKLRHRDPVRAARLLSPDRPYSASSPHDPVTERRQELEQWRIVSDVPRHIVAQAILGIPTDPEGYRTIPPACVPAFIDAVTEHTETLRAQGKKSTPQPLAREENIIARYAQEQ